MVHRTDRLTGRGDTFMRRTIVLAGITIALTLLLGPFASAGEAPEKYRPTVKKALDWLSAEQKANGSWEGRDGAFPVVLTCLAGIAMQMEGSTTNQGAYQKHLERAVSYLL